MRKPSSVGINIKLSHIGYTGVLNNKNGRKN